MERNSLLIFITLLLISSCNAGFSSWFSSVFNDEKDDLSAYCEVKDDSGIADEPIFGLIKFTQKGTGKVSIDIDLTGFAENGVVQHGFHIHVNPNLTDSCKDAGGHFNPENVDHAGPFDDIRHCGDLGNINRTGNGVNVQLVNSKISLHPADTCYFIGRSIVIHQGTDDLGRGGETDSKTTGHAGSRIGCCTIVEGKAGVFRELKNESKKVHFKAASLLKSIGNPFTRE